jgi:hypothetical protein
MKTSESEANGNRCPNPKCKQEMTKDIAGKGFVRHKKHKNPDKPCEHGKGERDEPIQKSTQS